MSRRDDSTFLSDAFFGNTMLPPNRNLDPSYQKLDLSGSYHVNRRFEIYSVVENLLDQHYDQVIGFPAPPLTFRAGFKVTLGGERAGSKGCESGRRSTQNNADREPLCVHLRESAA